MLTFTGALECSLSWLVRPETEPAQISVRFAIRMARCSRRNGLSL